MKIIEVDIFADINKRKKVEECKHSDEITAIKLITICNIMLFLNNMNEIENITKYNNNNKISNKCNNTNNNKLFMRIVFNCRHVKKVK